MTLQNPYAFPDDERQTGMTLRDWFAGQALTGLLACDAEDDVDVIYQAVATAAYKLADALLAERLEP
jgi:hypothetical protein